MTRKVPNVHQDYWRRVMRLKTAKNRMGPLPGLILLTIAVSVIALTVWSGMPFFVNDGTYATGPNFTFAGAMIIMTTGITGMLGLLILVGGLQNLQFYHALLSSMPPKPKDYCPEMASIADNIEKEIEILKRTVKQHATLEKRIGKLRDSINLNLECVKTYTEVMRENDIDVLTLLSP